MLFLKLAEGRRLLHPQFGFGLGSNANVFVFLFVALSLLPSPKSEMRVKESSARFKNNNFCNPWPEFNGTTPVISFPAKSFLNLNFFGPKVSSKNNFGTFLVRLSELESNQPCPLLNYFSALKNNISFSHP